MNNKKTISDLLILLIFLLLAFIIGISAGQYKYQTKCYARAVELKKAHYSYKTGKIIFDNSDIDYLLNGKKR
jgi:hypothetical protein